jgi:hypothetical protein
MKVRQNITIINDKEKQDMNEPKIRFQGFEGEWKSRRSYGFARSLCFSEFLVL